MVVHPAAGHASGTLVNALLHHLRTSAGLGASCGRESSTVSTVAPRAWVAKHDAAHQEFARQSHDREVEKEYIALVWGVVQAGRRIDAATQKMRA